MNVIQSAQVIMSLLPIVADVVKQVEALSTGSGNGSQKQQLVLTIMRQIYNASSPIEPFDGLVSKITDIITALVSFYNTVGAFVKGVKAVAA